MKIFHLRMILTIVLLECFRRRVLLRHADEGIDLFNLLTYLNQSSNNIPISKYFEEEKDLSTRYRNQLDYLATFKNDQIVFLL
jgi:hypothetical protein